MTVLIVDNYDSFTHNLYQLVGGLGVDVAVVRNDAIDVAAVREMAPTHIVLSPGPGHPGNARDFGVCAALINEYDPAVPMLGVCLGHQGIVHYHGGEVTHAPSIMHGKTSVITHDGKGVFAGLPPRLEVMRYHSLAATPSRLPDMLTVTAKTDDGVIMGIRHTSRPLFGVQFHPESIGTPDGAAMMRNFIDVRSPVAA